MSLRVLVCGGRNYPHRHVVFGVLDRLHADQPIATLIDGGAGGADRWGREWAIERDVTSEHFFADWSKFGRAAGPLRNRLMLAEGRPDLVVAFPGGRGTADLVRQAKEAGVKFIRIETESGFEVIWKTVRKWLRGTDAAKG